MFHTEDEARGKWCPLAGNQRSDHELCIASECMMWQRHVQVISPQGERAYSTVDQSKGYCGLTRR